jgi:hypothetical protein
MHRLMGVGAAQVFYLNPEIGQQVDHFGLEMITGVIAGDGDNFRLRPSF